MSTDALFTTMAGLQALSTQMDANAANLANVNTPGYAAVQAETEAAPFTGTNAPAGADAVALPPTPNTQLGPLTHTADPFNVALGGDAWLEVQTAAGGALTRDGALQITNAGLLADASGNPVLGVGGQPISVPNLTKLEIGKDGTVSGVPAGQPGAATQTYGQINLIATPAAGLTPITGSLFTASNGAALQPAVNGSVQQGYLNSSNVDPTQGMMDLIASSRSYQLQTGLMKTQSDSSQMLNSLLAQG